MNRLLGLGVLCIAVLSVAAVEAADTTATPMVSVISGEAAQIDLRVVFPDAALPIKTLEPPKPSEGWSWSQGGWMLSLKAPVVEKPRLGAVQLTDSKNRVFYLPVHVIHMPLHIFKYRPADGKKPGKVMLAGSFNGWNNSSNPLTDDDGNGVFERTEHLPAGQYMYKLVVDGDWISDPDNPRKSADGFNNSVLDMGAPPMQPPKLIPWEHRVPEPTNSRTPGPDALTFRVVNPGQLDPAQILVLVDGVPLEGKSKPVYKHPNLIVLAPSKFQTLRVEALTTDGARVPPVFLDRRPAGAVRDDILYFVMTDRFCNGDTTNDAPVMDTDLAWDANYQGGDFAGIIQKIGDGYFEKLGVTMLWISPPNDQPEQAFKDSLPPFKKFTGYHAYWPVHHERTESRFGTMEELRMLVRTAHAHNIRVIFDLVANHVHRDHPFFKEHPEWFGSIDLPDGSKNIRKWENPFSTWFDEFLPDINYDKDEVVDAMAKNARWWLDQTGADGFRLDAVKHVPLRYWLALRREMPSDTPVYFVGETIDSRKTISDFVGPGLLDGQFDFPLLWPIRDVFAFGRGSFADLDGALNAAENEYDPTAIHSTLVGNHDVSRFLCYADGDPESGDTVKVDKPESYSRLILAYAFLMTQNGLPMMYYGDEVGITGGKDPDNRRMMTFDITNAGASDNRRVFDAISRVNVVRHAHPALRRGTRRTLHATDKSYAYIRTLFDDRVLVTINRSDNEEALELELQPEFASCTLKDALSGATVEVGDDGRLLLTVPPLTAQIWSR